MERHFRNMLSEDAAYELQWNGTNTGFYVSIKEALLSRPWDVITLQQASHFSAFYETYQPYLTELAAYVRKLCPKAKIVIHQTWAYENGCPRSFEITDGKGAEFMLDGLRHAYRRAKAEIGAEGIIPSGELMELLRLKGAEGIYRDTFHAGYGLGRYAIALLWFKLFTGRSVLNNSFCELDVPASEKDLTIARECAESLSFE